MFLLLKTEATLHVNTGEIMVFATNKKNWLFFFFLQPTTHTIFSIYYDTEQRLYKREVGSHETVNVIGLKNLWTGFMYKARKKKN